ncbi:hypothetical protein Lesp02_62360 [Lentzea sp. NBRC 105346]|nr:hypothetical protein Lesp02_62360 [Lentzea sp. NBRC 105346]
MGGQACIKRCDTRLSGDHLSDTAGKRTIAPTGRSPRETPRKRCASAERRWAAGWTTACDTGMRRYGATRRRPAPLKADVLPTDWGTRRDVVGGGRVVGAEAGRVGWLRGGVAVTCAPAR